MTLKEQFLRNVSVGKGKSTIYTIKRALDAVELDIGKPLENAEWDDILTHIENLHTKSFHNSTINLHKAKIKQFLTFCFDETEDVRYTKIIKRLKGGQIVGEPPKPYEILTPEEIKRLINVSTLERDKCIIAVLFESGMRIGELQALTNQMVQMNEKDQEVIFNIPTQVGCKTGSRSVICLEIYGYVQDWQKCNTSDMFMPLSKSGMRDKIVSIFKRAGINKPANFHNFRHSSITNAVNIGMQQNAICMRFWGSPNSMMLSTYIHLNEQMTSQGYRNAKGMGDESKVINPLACRCVSCGKLIQSGNLCIQCKENADLKLKMTQHGNKLSDEGKRLIESEAQISDLKRQVQDMKDAIKSIVKMNKLSFEQNKKDFDKIKQDSEKQDFDKNKQEIVSEQ